MIQLMGRKKATGVTGQQAMMLAMRKEGMSYRKIGERWAISRQAAWDSIKRAEVIMSKWTVVENPAAVEIEPEAFFEA